MKYISIKIRVTLWFTVLMAIIVTLVLVFMLVVNGVGASYDAEYALLDALEENINDIDYDHGILSIDDLHFSSHGVFLSVYDADGALIAGSGIYEFDGSNSFEQGVTRQVTSSGREYLVRDEFVPDSYGGLWLRAVTLTTNNYSAVHVLTIISVILFPVLLVISAVGGWLIANHAFKPVRRITETVDAISDGNDLSKRIGLGKGRDEIYKLGATFDRLLDRLESSFESQKRFISDASHELRTPTSVILAQCEYSLDGDATVEDYRSSIEVVQRQALRLSDLTNQLLSLTRLDQGAQKARFEDAGLSELVEVICDETAPSLDRGITLNADIQPDVTVSMDVALMSRLVQNLLENACKYGKEGGSINVRLRAEDGNAILSVSDDGIGISPEDLPNIWTRFWQADPARGSASGAGLGLSMVKQIAQLHGGCMDVASTPGNGSTFTFTMPAK